MLLPNKFYLVLLLLPACITLCGNASELPAGLSTLSGRYIDVVTDMPVNDELRQLPAAFDAAVPIWCQAFGMPLAEADGWHVTAYLMLERDRFEAAGLIPRQVTGFVHGFQLGDQLWVNEQPSDYYRRHLLLHEGTHWFMNRKFGQAGPPWFMEGMAEWFGTHAWDGQQLKMNVIPRSRAELPYWGRITLIQQQLKAGTAPSLEAILRYGNTAHQQVEAYAWSWAAIVFLQHHPATKGVFAKLTSQTLRDDASLSRWLFAQLREEWPRLRSDWRAFVSDLDDGFDVTRGIFHGAPAPALGSAAVACEIRADQGWQPAGISLSDPTSLKITATGRVVVGQQPSPWDCEAQGVTLEYYRGEPLGKLMLAVMGPQAAESDGTHPIEVIPIGRGGEFRLQQAGEVYLRINESSGGLADNTGTFSVVISR